MTTARRIRIGTWLTGVLLLVAGLMWLAFPSAGAMGSLQDRQDRPLVVDRSGILDERQERSAVDDAFRLEQYGIPTLVVTEPAGLDQVQAEARANELRIRQGIESMPGANDGLLFYVSTDLYDPSNIVMSISVGGATLPRNGFTTAALDDIRTRIVAVQLAFGHPARAIVYSLREMIYLEQYVPPPPPPLSGWRTDVHSAMDLVAPVVGAAGCGWLLFIRRNRKTSRPTWIAPKSGLIIAGALAAGLLILAVASRSQTGVWWGVILGGLVIWQAIAWERAPSPDQPRAIQASARPPGGRQSARAATR